MNIILKLGGERVCNCFLKSYIGLPEEVLSELSYWFWAFLTFLSYALIDLSIAFGYFLVLLHISFSGRPRMYFVSS